MGGPGSGRRRGSGNKNKGEQFALDVNKIKSVKLPEKFKKKKKGTFKDLSPSEYKEYVNWTKKNWT